MLEPDKLRSYYESLNDEDLARQHGFGPSAFASAAVWQVVDEVYRARSMCAVLRQSEGLGMAVGFLIIPLAIPFVVAVVCALVFSALGLADGPDSLRWRLLLWYGCAALFTLQMVLLDQKAGGDRFSSGTVMLFAVLGFASLVATVTLPWWWLARHPPSQPGSRVP